ncbi:MAG: phospholipase [Microbacterium sp.]
MPETALPRANAITPTRSPRRRLGRTIAIVATGVAFLAAGTVSAVALTPEADPPKEFVSPVLGADSPDAVSAATEALGMADDALDAASDADVDTTALTQKSDALGAYLRLPVSNVLELADATETEASNLIIATDTWTEEERQREADEQAAAAEAAEAAALANTPEGAQATAKQIMADDYGWGDDQYQCVYLLWNKESGWNYQASNASSGAYGIPQALPGSKMGTVADDWETNATTQIIWGLQYISGSYGTPCSAWAHSQSYNWY